MSNPQMMPPPLPGYPGGAQPQAPQAAYPTPAQPAQAGYPMPPPPAPQGYPGPAVGAPPPPPPAHPPQGQAFPAYSQQPQQAPAPAAVPYNPQAVAAPPGDIGAAIAAATGGDRVPRFTAGTYLLQVIETIVTMHPQERYLTFKARCKVIESNNNTFQPGSEGAYIEGMAYGAGRVQDFLIGASGYINKAAFDAAMAGAGRNPQIELQLLANAAASPTTAQANNHYPPNPLGGRLVRTVVSEYDKIAGVKSRKAGQQVHVINHIWSPA